MTGFGEASTQIDGVHFFLEVRSLNSKYFKAVLRLPEELQGLEAELESALRQRLVRGAVTLVVKTTDVTASAAHQINAQAISTYIKQLRETPEIENGTTAIDLGALLTLPGVLQPAANEEQTLERGRRALTELLERAITQAIEMRRCEGGETLTALLEQHALIAERLQRVAVRAPEVVGAYQARLKSRVESMLSDAGATVEAVDLIREVAVYAEKSDIAEETTRLTAHLAQFEEIVSRRDDKPVGRTLDFLAQEMLREANTIASKSGDSEISRDIVEIKGAIDRIKEQVQNVE